MVRYLQKVKDLTLAFTILNIYQILRTKIARANLLSKLATMEIFDLKRSSYFEVLQSPSIEKVPTIM